MQRRTVYTLLSVIMLLLSILPGCGGSSAPPPPVISVSVSPSTASVIAGATQQFTATVSGTTSTAVTWNVSSCTGTTCGTIDTNGLYTAPSLIPNPITVSVVATLQSDSTKSGSAKVSQVPVAVSIAEDSINVNGGQTYQFTATVTGHTNTSVTWGLSGCSEDACGTISSTGLYAAASRIPDDGTVTVVATSVADSTKSDSVMVHLNRVKVQVTPAEGTLYAGQTSQFAATVTGTSNTAVTWSVSICNLGACGAVNSSGLYTAPSSIAAAADVIVTATSQADPDEPPGVATVHLAPISLRVSPSGTVNVPLEGTQNFTATVTGDPSSEGVTWSLDASCTPATCGTLGNISNTSVTYTAPATIPNPATVTLTATSVADPTKSANVVITVIAAPLLAPGDYAFVFSGWEGLGGGNFGRQVTVGHFHADANGNITGGVEDVNNHTGVSLSVSITGTYTVNPNRRGTLTIVSAQDTATYSMTVDSSGTKGNFIRLNSSSNPPPPCNKPYTHQIKPAACDVVRLNNSANPVSGSGFFEQQVGLPYSQAALAGPYALYLTAKPNDSVSMAAVGRFTGSSSGALSNGKLDMLAPTATYSQITLGGTMGAPSATGRGTATLTLSPAPGAFSSTMQFVYYAISANKLLWMQSDTRGATVPLLSGEAQRQSGSFSDASLNAAAIFELAGMHSTYQSVIVGQMTPDGAGSMTGIFDQNLESNVMLNQSFSGTYTVDSSGRATMTMLNGNAFAYFFGPNQAYVIEKPDTDVLYGNLKPQTAGPYNPASLSTFRFAEAEPATAFAESDSGIMTFDGVSSFSLEQDYTFFYSDGTYVQSPQTQGGTYTLDTNGRGVLSMSMNGYNLVLPFWMVSPDEMTAVDTATSGLDSLPVVLHFMK